jgi:hypothetical protein
MSLHTGTGGGNVTEARQGSSPTVLRMILGRQLQALREGTSLSYEEAAEAVYTSAWTIRRMEKGAVPLKPVNVKGLLVRYGVTDVREIDAFIKLAQEANKPGWWHNFTDVLPPWFRVAVGLEEAASLIRAYEPQVVPGLLQTEDYIRAETVASFPDASEEETERRIALRLARQDLLMRPDAPEFWAVLDETVLRRPIGGREVMRAQLAHLIEDTDLPNVTVQVVPFAAGWHPAMGGMFWTYRFPSRELPDIVYGENLTSSFYLNKPEDVAVYVDAMERMCAQAASPEQTVSILRDAMKEI